MKISVSPTRLHQAVMSVSQSIDAAIRHRDGRTFAEAEMRCELVACLLGSQVRAESANAAVSRLKRAGLLSSRRWKMEDDSFEGDVRAVLAGRDPSGRTASYRFPALRARQLAALRDCLVRRPLRSYSEQSKDPRKVRQLLVRDLPGIGPKQASMFIRNVGWSSDLAILDSHVLKFLCCIGVLPAIPQGISGLDAYERVEDLVAAFCRPLGRTVGHIDWAIWITMRAAAEVQS